MGAGNMSLYLVQKLDAKIGGNKSLMMEKPRLAFCESANLYDGMCVIGTATAFGKKIVILHQGIKADQTIGVLIQPLLRTEMPDENGPLLRGEVVCS